MASKARSSARQKKHDTTPAPSSFCTNCGQKVLGQVALNAADADIKYCGKHGVALRDDGSCPMEDNG